MIPARGVVCHLGLAPLLNVPSDGKTVPEDMPSSLHWGRLGGRVGWGLRQHGGGGARPELLGEGGPRAPEETDCEQRWTPGAGSKGKRTKGKEKQGCFSNVL